MTTFKVTDKNHPLYNREFPEYTVFVRYNGAVEYVPLLVGANTIKFFARCNLREVEAPKVAEPERETLTLEPVPELVGKYWQLSVTRNDPQAVDMYQRHYSYRKREGKQPDQFGNPGYHMALMTANRDALFFWSKEKFRMDEQEGVNCAVFRNEGKTLSSVLIQEACEIAWRRWPLERLFTFVDTGKIRSSNPGYCFKKAGFKECGKTSNGLLIFERLPVLEAVRQPNMTDLDYCYPQPLAPVQGCA